MQDCRPKILILFQRDRAALGTRRQIAKTKPSIQAARRTGAFHRLTRRRTHTNMGVWHTHETNMHTVKFEPGNLRLRLRCEVIWPLSKGKKRMSQGALGVAARTLPTGLEQSWTRKRELTIVQSAGNAPRRGVRRSRACMRVHLRACLGWPNFEYQCAQP